MFLQGVQCVNIKSCFFSFELGEIKESDDGNSEILVVRRNTVSE